MLQMSEAGEGESWLGLGRASATGKLAQMSWRFQK